MHPDDEFHPPTSDDPYWTETCWFTFTVPERRLSGQLYPFFRQNQGVVCASAFFWDDSGSDWWNLRYAKTFWHLPWPETPLSDLVLGNGIRYRVVDPQRVYAIAYDDPDGGDELHVDLTFTAVTPPHHLGTSHVDQPGRYTGTVVLDGEEIAVDAYGFRDRSWGPRSQFGQALMGGVAPNGGYTYATASERDAFHLITMNYAGDGCRAIHGYHMRDGEWSKITSGTREVLERDDRAQPTRVVVDAVDELGRELHADGRGLNAATIMLNPNLMTVNCLYEWTFDGITAYGEDHDNWSVPAGRRFFREYVQGRR